MEINIQQTDRQFEFTASNDAVSFPVVANENLSGDAKGFRPMELLLVGLGGCMSIDVLNILYKQQQEITAYRVKVTATRVDTHPAVFDEIYVHLVLTGNVAENKLDRAIQLSKDKYCSAFHMLNAASNIHITSTINAR